MNSKVLIFIVFIGSSRSILSFKLEENSEHLQIYGSSPFNKELTNPQELDPVITPLVKINSDSLFVVKKVFKERKFIEYNSEGKHLLYTITFIENTLKDGKSDNTIKFIKENEGSEKNDFLCIKLISSESSLTTIFFLKRFDDQIPTTQFGLTGIEPTARHKSEIRYTSSWSSIVNKELKVSINKKRISMVLVNQNLLWQFCEEIQSKVVNIDSSQNLITVNKQKQELI